MGEKIIREKEMAVPVDSLFKAITDYKSYPKFLSEVVGVKIESEDGKGNARVTFELEVVKRFEYTLEFSAIKNEKVSWKLVKSNFFKNNEGGWHLTSLGKNQTDVKYELEVGFGFLVPGWITKKLTENSLPQMLESFEKRARELSN